MRDLQVLDADRGWSADLANTGPRQTVSMIDGKWARSADYWHATHVTLTLPQRRPRLAQPPASQRFPKSVITIQKKPQQAHPLNAAPFYRQLGLGSARHHPPHSLLDIFSTLKPGPYHRDPDTMEEERLWKFRKPEWLNSMWARNAGVYAAGALFSIAFYVMLDSAVWSKSAKNGSNVHVKFVDWLPLIFSSLGMLIINSVEKQRLSTDSFSYSGSGVAWKARVVLFLGFAALAGGMAGGVTVFVLKFVVPGVGMPALSMGIENLVSNALVGFSSVVLWISQNMEDEYSYNLSL
ncbi:hypothetical protein FP744_10009703 [Trichoderma asperellum]